jgi:hypothetical protein
MHILGQSKVLKHGPLRIWAERGLVRIEDSRAEKDPNRYKPHETITVLQCAQRCKALSDMIKNSMSTNEVMSYDDVIELQRILDGYVDIMRQAQEQGMPSDASARRDLVRRRPVSININANMDLEF